jgi:hypothetical protein
VPRVSVPARIPIPILPNIVSSLLAELRRESPAASAGEATLAAATSSSAGSMANKYEGRMETM